MPSPSPTEAKPRTIGYVVQMEDPGQGPRPVIVAVGGPPWAASQLQRLAPDSVKVSVIDPEDLYQALARRPHVALWTHLFTPIAGEHRWDLRGLRLTSVLEGMARETSPSNLALALPDGTPCWPETADRPPRGLSEAACTTSWIRRAEVWECPTAC